MSAFDYFQLVVDIVFLFLILVLLVGRGWRRGAVAEEQESYREMVSRLSSLIGEMKETSADLQDRLGQKQVEVQHSIGLCDDRIRRVKDLTASLPPAGAGSAAPRLAPAMPAAAAPEGGPRPPLAPPRGPVAARETAEPAPVPAPRGEHDDEERREKYRQALDFAQKGWSALDIARFTQLPRGEVELLMRTKGKQI